MTRRFFLNPCSYFLTAAVLAGLIAFFFVPCPAAAEPGKNPKTGPDLREEPLKLKGFLYLRGGQDIVEDATTPNEQKNSFRNIVRLEGKWYPEKTSNKYLLASVESDYLWFGPESEWDDYELNLYEGFLYYREGPIDLAFGRQIIRWGKTDDMSPVDTLNAQDLREFIVPEYGDRKIPNWLVRLRLLFSAINIEGVYIPLFEPAQFDYFGTDWAVFGHLKTDILKSDLPAPLKEYIRNLSVNDERPTEKLENGEWGIRIYRPIAGWDVGVSYLYSWEDLPFFESFPIKNIHVDGSTSYEALKKALAQAVFTDESIEVRYKRVHQAGFEFETTLGVFGLRGEFAYYDLQSFLTASLTSVRKPVYHYVLGLDYSGESDWYVNVQFSHQIIADYDPAILYFEEHNTSLLGKLEKGFWDGNFRAKLEYGVFLNQEGHYLSPAVIFKYIPNLDITLGGKIFGGKPDTFFGRYDANDEIFLSLKYQF